MTKAGPTGSSGSPRAAAREARAERLAAALKANLRRRKAQVRERATPPSVPPGKGAEVGIERTHDQDC